MDALVAQADTAVSLDEGWIDFALDLVNHSVKHLRPLSPTASDGRRSKRMRIIHAFKRLQHTMNDEDAALFSQPAVDDGGPRLVRRQEHADAGEDQSDEEEHQDEDQRKYPASDELETASQSSRAGGRPLLQGRSAMNYAVPKRLAFICTAFAMDRILPEDVPALMDPVRVGTHAKVEDAAFMILCRGYQMAAQRTWDELLSSQAVQLAGSDEYRDHSQELDQLEDTDQRLLQALAQMTVSHGANQWLVQLMKHIETLKFAIDWNSARGQGSKRQKTWFYQQTFAQQPHLQDVFAGLSRKDTASTIRNEYAQDFKDWKRKNETTVTARNRLFLLYNFFGSPVFIDSVWTVDHLATQRSRAFMKVFASLSENVPTRNGQTAIEHLQDGHQRGRLVLLAIINALGAGVHVKDHLMEFLDEHPPAHQLSVVPGDD
ncbi:hypothetical protein EIP86_008144 [Pleurotus ostreatoroseus]|nr:hypothetical protein EIP86_008144 [Pleurotus ostreatoroseus]